MIVWTTQKAVFLSGPLDESAPALPLVVSFFFYQFAVIVESEAAMPVLDKLDPLLESVIVTVISPS